MPLAEERYRELVLRTCQGEPVVSIWWGGREGFQASCGPGLLFTLSASLSKPVAIPEMQSVALSFLDSPSRRPLMSLEEGKVLSRAGIWVPENSGLTAAG